MLSVLVFYASFAVGLCAVIIAPKNTAVIAGQRLTLECQVDNNSTVQTWTYINSSNSSQKPEYIVSRELDMHIRSNQKFSRFDANFNNSGLAVLSVNSTNLEDAGLYKCEVETGNKATLYSAQVIVFASEPNCSTNFSLPGNRSLTQGDRIWMQCSVDYNGNWAPSMIWRQYFMDTERNDSGMIITNGSAIVSKSSVVSIIIVDIDFQLNASYFECETTFTSEINSSRDATGDQPEFSHIWRSSMILLMIPEDLTSSITNTFSAVTDISNVSQGNNWFVISITLTAVVTVLFVSVAISVCVNCIYFRGKSSDKVKNRTISGEYDFIHDAIDGCEAIDNKMIEKDVPLEFIPRQGPLPSSGYSVLMVPAESSGYSKMNQYGKLEEHEAENRKHSAYTPISPGKEDYLGNDLGEKITTGKDATAQDPTEKGIPRYVSIIHGEETPAGSSSNVEDLPYSYLIPSADRPLLHNNSA